MDVNGVYGPNNQQVPYKRKVVEDFEEEGDESGPASRRLVDLPLNCLTMWIKLWNYETWYNMVVLYDLCRVFWDNIDKLAENCIFW